LSIGDEVVQGRIVDTNAPWLAQQLIDAGRRSGVRVELVEMATVSDASEHIERALVRLSAGADLLIATGGLGPTLDDRTREALGRVVSGPTVRDVGALDALTLRLERSGLALTAAQARQADRPSDFVCIPNEHGTAPGLHGALHEAEVLLLPGPPDELRPMVRDHVLQALAVFQHPDGEVMHTQSWVAFGLAESVVATALGDRLCEGHDPHTSIRVSNGLLHVQQSSVDKALLLEDAVQVEAALGSCGLPAGCDSPAHAVHSLMAGRGMRLAVAESCTGGLIGGAITAIPGSSQVFAGGIIAYDAHTKINRLGVDAALLADDGPGAVSAAVVEAMAHGACEAFGADAAISVSGIAGPDGGTPDKPVGTVFIGTCVEGTVRHRRVLLPSDRRRVRTWAVHAALMALLWHLNGVDAAMQWDAAT
jgi:nicotinamide-nucleotide amidase